MLPISHEVFAILELGIEHHAPDRFQRAGLATPPADELSGRPGQAADLVCAADAGPFIGAL